MGKINFGHETHKGMGRDPHASAEHHAANKKHGMEDGCCPKGDYEAGEAEGLTGGNAEYANE